MPACAESLQTSRKFDIFDFCLQKSITNHENKQKQQTFYRLLSKYQSKLDQTSTKFTQTSFLKTAKLNPKSTHLASLPTWMTLQAGAVPLALLTSGPVERYRWEREGARISGEIACDSALRAVILGETSDSVWFGRHGWGIGKWYSMMKVVHAPWEKRKIG